MKMHEIVQETRKYFGSVYKDPKRFLRYPDDLIIRFHQYYLKNMFFDGKILDYGFGSGNNSIY